MCHKYEYLIKPLKCLEYEARGTSRVVDGCEIKPELIEMESTLRRFLLSNGSSSDFNDHVANSNWVLSAYSLIAIAEAKPSNALVLTAAHNRHVIFLKSN